jgi:hypothetical protein
MNGTKLTFKEIVQKLKENNIAINQVAHGDFGGGWSNKYDGVADIGPSEEIDQYGGEECGIEWYTVRHFTDHDVYIRIEASYYSYEGVDFSNAEYIEVQPTKVTRIEYLPVKHK